MSGASVVHTTSDYDIDGMNTARGFGQYRAGTGTRRRPGCRSLRQRRAADGGRSEIFALPWALLATARTGRSGTGHEVASGLPCLVGLLKREAGQSGSPLPAAGETDRAAKIVL